MAFVSLTDLVYPVGSVYISFVKPTSTSDPNHPSVKFGGTWTTDDCAGKFLRGVASNSNLTDGGSDTHRHRYKLAFASSFFSPCALTNEYEKSVIEVDSIRMNNICETYKENNTSKPFRGSSDDGNNNSTGYKGTSPSNHYNNSGLSQGRGTIDNPDVFINVADTSDGNSLPAYKGVYIGRRTA